jgi:hypothetical protein
MFLFGCSDPAVAGHMHGHNANSEHTVLRQFIQEDRILQRNKQTYGLGLSGWSITPSSRFVRQIKNEEQIIATLISTFRIAEKRIIIYVKVYANSSISRTACNSFGFPVLFLRKPQGAFVRFSSTIPQPQARLA